MILLAASCAVEEGEPVVQEADSCVGHDIWVAWPLSIGKAEFGRDLWQDAGFKLGPVDRWKKVDSLPDEGIFMFIEASLVEEASHHKGFEMAAFAARVDGTTGPLCMIVFRDNASSRFTYAHELGHAIGFHDDEIRGSVMAFNPEIGGVDTHRFIAREEP